MPELDERSAAPHRIGRFDKLSERTPSQPSGRNQRSPSSSRGPKPRSKSDTPTDSANDARSHRGVRNHTPSRTLDRLSERTRASRVAATNDPRARRGVRSHTPSGRSDKLSEQPPTNRGTQPSTLEPVEGSATPHEDRTLRQAQRTALEPLEGSAPSAPQPDASTSSAKDARSHRGVRNHAIPELLAGATPHKNRTLRQAQRATAEAAEEARLLTLGAPRGAVMKVGTPTP